MSKRKGYPLYLLALLAHTGQGQAEDSAELAKKALNPVAAMYSLPVQYNWDQKIGPDGWGFRFAVTLLFPR